MWYNLFLKNTYLQRSRNQEFFLQDDALDKIKLQMETLNISSF